MSAARPETVVTSLGKRHRRAIELEDIAFTVALSQMLAVVGSDGAGKTTLIQVQAGLLAPTAGRAVVAGLDVARAGTSLGERIGTTYQRASSSMAAWPR